MELLNSFSLSSSGCRPSSGLQRGAVNDAVLPSGRLLKATCHISPSIRGFSREEVHLSPACQHRH